MEHGIEVSQFSFRPKSIIDEKLSMGYYGNMVFDIILSAINDELPEEENNLKYSIDVKPYCRAMGYRKLKDAYRAMKLGIDELYKFDIVVGNEQHGMRFRILTSEEWDSENMTFRFTLGETTKKLLLIEKKKNINTFYMWRYSLPLKSKYAVKLYYCLKEWEKSTGVRYDAVERLKEILQIPSSYRYPDMKRVLVESLKEIEEKTDIKADMYEHKETIKGGKRVTKLEFRITENQEVKELPLSIEETIRTKLKEVGVELDDKVIKRMTHTAFSNCLSDDVIKQRISQVAKNNNKSNPAGYYIFAMSGDYKDGNGHSNFCDMIKSDTDYSILWK